MSTGIGDRIVELRMNKGLKQGEFAEMIGLSSQQKLSQYEKGKVMPPLSVITDICKTFDVTYEWLIEGAEIAESSKQAMYVVPETMGERISHLRRQSRLSQEEFAKKLHTNQRLVSNYESGHSIPPKKFLDTLVGQYDVSYDWLMGKDNGMVREYSEDDYNKLVRQTQRNHLDIEDLKDEIKRLRGKK